MSKKITFETCKDCIFSNETSIIGILCPTFKSNGRVSSWKLIRNGEKSKPEDCPYPNGVKIDSCRHCPHLDQGYGINYCNNIEEGCLVEIDNIDNIDIRCKLEDIEKK